MPPTKKDNMANQAYKQWVKNQIQGIQDAYGIKLSTEHQRGFYITLYIHNGKGQIERQLASVKDWKTISQIIDGIKTGILLGKEIFSS